MKNITTWINSLNERFWRSAVNSTETSIYSLAIFRILTGAFLLFIIPVNYTWMADLPKAFFLPPILSPVNLFANDFPDKVFLVIADFTLLAAITAIILGIKPRVAALIFVLMKLLMLNYQYSFGKVDHEILFPAMLACLSFSGWGQKLSLWPDRISRFDSVSKSMSLLAVLICFGYLSASLEKALYWVNFDVNSTGSARWFYNSLYFYQRQPLLAPYFKTAAFWIFKSMDIICVVFELLPFIALMYSRKAWKSWLLIAASFHLANLLIFNINFIGNGIVYLAFVDYSATFTFLKQMFSRHWFKIAATSIIGYAIVIRTLSILTSTKTGIIFLPNNANNSLYGMLCLWTLICITILIDVLHSKKRNLPYEIDVLSPQLHKNNLIDHQTTI